jgi:hypothetical protein
MQPNPRPPAADRGRTLIDPGQGPGSAPQRGVSQAKAPAPPSRANERGEAATRTALAIADYS